MLRVDYLIVIVVMNRNATIADVQALREAYRQFVIGAFGGDFVWPVSMVNNGYLHFLNASFDGINLRETGADSLLEPRKPANFGTIQPCVRAEDADDEKAGRDLLHLGLFEILGNSTWGFEAQSPSQMAAKTIREFAEFYSKLGMDPKRLKVYYFGGGTLREASHGVVKSDEFIEPDGFSVDLWKQSGLEGLVEEQLVPEPSNETFLLHLGRPLKEHHSGYRNDIFYKVGDLYFEIATLNLISHQTVIERGNIVGIKPLPFYLREMALGQERILAAMQGTDDLYQLPHIKPLVEAVAGMASRIEQGSARKLIDALRVVHYVISDVGSYSALSGKKLAPHREELNTFTRRLVKGVSEMEVGTDGLVQLLGLNAQLQPWYPQLAARSSQEAVVEGIALYSQRAPRAK